MTQTRTDPSRETRAQRKKPEAARQRQQGAMQGAMGSLPVMLQQKDTLDHLKNGGGNGGQLDLKDKLKGKMGRVAGPQGARVADHLDGAFQGVVGAGSGLKGDGPAKKGADEDRSGKERGQEGVGEESKTGKDPAVDDQVQTKDQKAAQTPIDEGQSVKGDVRKALQGGDKTDTTDVDRQDAAQGGAKADDPAALKAGVDEKGEGTDEKTGQEETPGGPDVQTREGINPAPVDEKKGEPGQETAGEKKRDQEQVTGRGEKKGGKEGPGPKEAGAGKTGEGVASPKGEGHEGAGGPPRGLDEGVVPGGGDTVGVTPGEGHESGGPLGAGPQGVTQGGASETQARGGETAGQSPEAAMSSWISSHPSEKVKSRNMQLAMATEGALGRARAFPASVPKPLAKMGLLGAATNWLTGWDGMVSAIKSNPFKMTKGPWYERALAVIHTVKPVISMVGDVADKIGVIATIAGLVGMFFPPVGAFCLTVGRIANIVSLVAKGIDFALSMTSAVLSAIAIRFEKDPVKRIQMAGVLRQSVTEGIASGLDAIVSKIGAKVGGGAVKGFKGAKGGLGKKLLGGLKGAGKGAKELGKDVVKGVKGFGKTIGKGFSNVKGFKKMMKGAGGAMLQKVAPTEAIKGELKTISKIRDWKMANSKSFVWKPGVENVKKRWKSGPLKPFNKYGKWATDFNKMMGVPVKDRKGIFGTIWEQKKSLDDNRFEEAGNKAYEDRFSSEAGARTRSKVGSSSGSSGSGGELLAGFESRIAALANGSAPGGGTTAAKVPDAPRDDQAVAQPEDIEGLRAQKRQLEEAEPEVDAAIQEATERRDEMLNKVAPDAVAGGKAAMTRANEVAEQKSENAKERQGFQEAKKEGAKGQAEQKKAGGQATNAQSTANEDVAKGNAAMNPEPLESKVNEEAKKKAEEDYRKEKEEWEKAGLLKKAWMSVKKFAKTVWDFMASAVKWVMKNVIGPIIEKVKSVIAKVMSYITGVIMKFLLKTIGGMSDGEAQMLAFGAQADQAVAKSEQADVDLGKANVVALEASDKATRTERAAIEEANRCNENIATGKQIKEELAAQRQAIDAQIAADEAEVAAFKAQFLPYFAAQGRSQGTDGQGETGEPVVDGGIVSDLGAAAATVSAGSAASQVGFRSEADQMRDEMLTQHLKAMKEYQDQQRASRRVGGFEVGDSSEYDTLYNQNAARLRNEATVYARQVVEAHTKVEADRQGRVRSEGQRATAYQGQPIAACEAALRQIAANLRGENTAVGQARDESKKTLEQGLSRLFS